MQIETSGQEKLRMRVVLEWRLSGKWTSVWSPIRTNRIWTRCTACTHANDVNDDHRKCERCGAELPARQTFW